ncbi:MAG TPA: hypothetical protein DCE44_24895 [Verrucomicrobiales bacterium]|nr:hypothetical protein [Verrucomicrobiales bacterium]
MPSNSCLVPISSAKTSRPITLKYLTGGSFDFSAAALPCRKLNPVELSWRISDHLPLWAEFGVRDGDGQ